MKLPGVRATVVDALVGVVDVVDHARVVDRRSEPVAALTVVDVIRARSLCGDGRGYHLNVDLIPSVEDPAQADDQLDQLTDAVLDQLELVGDDTGLRWESAQWLQLRDLGRAVRVTITATP